MKVFSTILVALACFVIGLLFVSYVNNAGKNVSKSSVKKIQNDEYHSQFKHRDFISEKREKERKEINSHKNARKDNTGSHDDDFMAYNRLDSARFHHEDFR